MHRLKRLGSAVLAASLVMSSAPLRADGESIGDFVPDVPGVDMEKLSQDGSPAPQALTDLFREKARQAINAPTRLKAALVTRVKSYFAPNLDMNRPLPEANVEKLVQDADYVAEKLEEDDDTGQFRDFIEKNLNPFIRSLRPQQIVSTLTTKGAAIGDWTLQTLVVSRMLNYISGTRDFSKRALGLITGRHLKAAGRSAILLVLLSVGYHLIPNVTTMIGLFVLFTFWDAFKAGPVGTILNAGSGWFVRPTSEQLKVLEQRFTYQWEIGLNNFYDRLNPKTDPKAEVTNEIFNRNDRVQIATLEKDNMDFAGETAEDQLINWENGKEMFVVVCKRFGQLLRDTHHGGRDLMMLSWTDQQNITQLVETMDSKLKILRGESRSILNPLKTAYANHGEFGKKEELEQAFFEFEALCNRFWQEPDLDEAGRDKLAQEIVAARDHLSQFEMDGKKVLSKFDIAALQEIQQERGRAVGTMVTTLAIGELRAFYGAERNRNLAPAARSIERTIRRGLGNQYYVTGYLDLVARELRNMGQRVTGRQKAPAPQGMTVEQCLIIQLRRAFQMPPVSVSNSQLCTVVLWSKAEKSKFDAGGNDSPVSRYLQQFQDSAKRNEALSIFNEAWSIKTRPIDVQSGAKFAIESCVH
jgi:hypothetical protein